jgi:restriction endonuclease Mrr
MGVRLRFCDVQVAHPSPRESGSSADQEGFSMNTPKVQKQKTRQSEFVRWFGPLLQALRDLGGSASPREALDRIAEIEKVPDTLRNEILKSGQERFYNQVHWARQYLVWEGYIESGTRGVWSLTQTGKNVVLTPEQARQIFLQQVQRQAKLRKPSAGSELKPIQEDEIARAEAERPGAVPIELVDGEKLFEMFKRYGLGLKPRTVYDIDVSFFEQFE